MSKPDKHEPHNHPGQRMEHWWRWVWPKARVALQIIAGQLIGWALRKWLGE